MENNSKRRDGGYGCCLGMAITVSILIAILFPWLVWVIWFVVRQVLESQYRWWMLPNDVPEPDLIKSIAVSTFLSLAIVLPLLFLLRSDR
jgi:hypothetical protein